MDWNTWGPPLLVLLLGVIVGLVVAMRTRPGASHARAADREALLARKEGLLEQLRALEADRGSLTPAEWEGRREALLAEGADALRALDALEVAAGPLDAGAVAGADASAGAAGASSRRLGWAVGVLAFFALLGVVLTEASRPRAQGGSMTGGGPDEAAAAAAGAPAPERPEVGAARAALAANPQDLAALNLLSYEALLVRDFQTAMGHIEVARQLAPEDPDVLTHLAILQIAVGMADRAEPSLEAAAAARPTSGKPLLWLGLLRAQLGRTDDAKATLERALALELRGDERQFAAALLAEANAPRAPAGPVPEAMAAGGGGGEAPVAAGPPRLGVTVRLADGVQARPDQRIFLIVHRSAEGRGPPVAARPLSPGDLPAEVSLSDGDQMMQGQPWPAEVWVFARLDADGVAGSSPGDVESAKLGPVAAGTTGLTLTIGG